MITELNRQEKEHKIEDIGEHCQFQFEGWRMRPKKILTTYEDVFEDRNVDKNGKPIKKKKKKKNEPEEPKVLKEFLIGSQE